MVTYQRSYSHISCSDFFVCDPLSVRVVPYAFLCSESHHKGDSKISRSGSENHGIP